MKFMKHGLAFAFTVLATIAQAEGDPVTPFATDDGTMNAAIAQAQTTLPFFLANALDDDGYGNQGTSLKVAFPVKNAGENEKEVIWVNPFRVFDDGTAAGLLANEPHFMPGLNAGDRVDFTTDMIYDWALWRADETSYGNYTTRVIAIQMGADGKDLLDRMIIPPVPADW